MCRTWLILSSYEATWSSSCTRSCLSNLGWSVVFGIVLWALTIICVYWVFVVYWRERRSHSSSRGIALAPTYVRTCACRFWGWWNSLGMSYHFFLLQLQFNLDKLIFDIYECMYPCIVFCSFLWNWLAGLLHDSTWVLLLTVSVALLLNTLIPYFHRLCTNLYDILPKSLSGYMQQIIVLLTKNLLDI